MTAVAMKTAFRKANVNNIGDDGYSFQFLNISNFSTFAIQNVVFCRQKPSTTTFVSTTGSSKGKF